MNKEGQSEVTNRLRSAIKKKLAEISDFEDDELPEYIMILVANQRSKSQIEKDLSLFLRNDTVSFTNWLWALLNSLNVGNKNQKGSLSNSDSKESKQNFDVDDDAVIIDCGPDEQENDLLSPDGSNDSLSRPSSRRSYSDQLEDVLTEATECHTDKAPEKEKDSPVKKEQNLQVKQEKRSPPKKCVPLNQEQKLLRKKNTHPLLLLNKNAKDRVNSKVVPIKRRLVNSDDEYDPSKPGYINRSNNKVSRNYGGPAALQANKLLLKAVDDATKSILVGQNIEDFYKPTPIKVLTSKRFKNSAPPVEELEPVIERSRSTIIPKLDYDFGLLQNLGSNEPEYPNYSFTDDSSLNLQYSPQASRRICLRPIPLISDSPETTNIGVISQDASEYAINPVEETRPKSPHFIVTLEGVNLSFKNTVKENADDSLEEIEDDHMSVEEYDDDDPSPDEKVKVERCKYWPACKNSDNCIFHHPTTPCKCFPDCKFGDKCLYIHPNCKFDALCSRKDCPFTHASKRKLTLSTHPMRMVPVKKHKPNVVCKYYPKCTATNCLFIHPKLCRYGKECRLPSCSFSHFSLPSRSQLKWKA